MVQSHSLSTNLPSLSFWSVFTRMLKRSTTRPYQQLSKLASNWARVPLVELWRLDEENKVHPHVVVMASKGFAVDKLAAKEVLVTYVKAAEDSDLLVLATASTLGTTTMLHAPQKPSNINAVKLFVRSVRRRKPKASKPMAMKVVQIMGYLFAEIFQRFLFLEIICVLCPCVRGSNLCGKCSEPAIVTSTTLKRVRYPTRSLGSSTKYCIEAYRLKPLNFPLFSYF